MPLGLISPVWRGSGPTFPQPRLSTPVCEIPTETEVPAHTSRLQVGMLRALPRPPVFHGPGDPITALILLHCHPPGGHLLADLKEESGCELGCEMV